MADVGISRVLVALDDFGHLLWCQVGVQPLAEFASQSFDGGFHFGLSLSVAMVIYSAQLLLLNHAADFSNWIRALDPALHLFLKSSCAISVARRAFPHTQNPPTQLLKFLC